MKTITLEEFSELAKNDETLQKKIIEIATHMGESTQTDEMTALASEYGYELEKRPSLDMEELSDDDLENVAGGNAFCEAVLEWLGYDIKLCY